jgi:hypothetical protein
VGKVEIRMLTLLSVEERGQARTSQSIIEVNFILNLEGVHIKHAVERAI